MNKKNGIIIGVLALIVTMMVGYAIFTETITINGTATAQGNFDLTYTCEKQEMGGTGSCKVDGNTITTTSTLSMPNDVVAYNVTITNTGTIPALLKTVTSSNNTSYDDFVSPGDGCYIDKATYLFAMHQVESSNGPIVGDSNIEAAKIILQPGESRQIVIFNQWGDSEDLGGTQPKLPEAGAKISYNVTYGFEQIQAQ